MRAFHWILYFYRTICRLYIRDANMCYVFVELSKETFPSIIPILCEGTGRGVSSKSYMRTLSCYKHFPVGTAVSLSSCVLGLLSLPVSSAMLYAKKTQQEMQNEPKHHKISQSHVTLWYIDSLTVQC